MNVLIYGNVLFPFLLFLIYLVGHILYDHGKNIFVLEKIVSKSENDDHFGQKTCCTIVL